MSDLWKAYAHLYPDARPGVHYVLQDDGRGAYLAVWKLAGDPPDEKAIEQAITAYDARQTKNGAKKARQHSDAAGAVGKVVASLKQSEKDALLELILERLGALDEEGKIRPPEMW